VLKEFILSDLAILPISNGLFWVLIKIRLLHLISLICLLNSEGCINMVKKDKMDKQFEMEEEALKMFEKLGLRAGRIIC
jgi:hypothetical protein